MSIVHEENAITLLPRPYYTLAAMAESASNLTLLSHTQGPPTLNNSCSPLNSLLSRKKSNVSQLQNMIKKPADRA